MGKKKEGTGFLATIIQNITNMNGVSPFTQGELKKKSFDLQLFPFRGKVCAVYSKNK